MKKTYVRKINSAKADLWASKRPVLSRLDMELTERCNNNCVHCFINKPADDTRALEDELAKDEIRRILEEAAGLGCLTVRFTGGEPLLRQDFEEIYLTARKAGLRVIIFTNATLLTPRLADLLAAVPPLMKVEVTLYGMRKEAYEAVSRRKGSFEAARRGVRLLLEKKVPFIVKGAVLPQNKHEVEAFEAWARSLPGMSSPPSFSMFFDLHIYKTGKNNSIRKLRLPPEEGARILSRNKDRYETETLDFCRRFSRPEGDLLFSCGAGLDSGLVDAYGRFYPCMMLRHHDAAYDLRKGTLREGLVEFFPRIREWRSSNREYLDRCGRCFLKSLCQQCPGRSWLEHGRPDQPVEYFCAVAHAQALAAGMIGEGEKAWEVEDWKTRLERSL
jgi:radical SAM protein with 4Fe4S-binding SPASM domain